jgi:hypothetical protein
MCPAHRASGGQETAGARPAAMAELCLLYVPVLRLRRRPQEMAGGARPAAMAEHSPSSRSRRGDTSHASPCLAERRHEKAAGARPAAMSERLRNSRSRRHLPCVPASGRAEAVDGSRSSAGRHGRELLDTLASGRARAPPATGAVCEAARWVDASRERQSDGFANERSRVRGGEVGGSPLGQADPSGTHHRSLAARIPGSAPSKKEGIR